MSLGPWVALTPQAINYLRVFNAYLAAGPGRDDMVVSDLLQACAEDLIRSVRDPSKEAA